MAAVAAAATSAERWNADTQAPRPPPDSARRKAPAAGKRAPAHAKLIGWLRSKSGLCSMHASSWDDTLRLRSPPCRRSKSRHRRRVSFEAVRTASSTVRSFA